MNNEQCNNKMIDIYTILDEIKKKSNQNKIPNIQGSNSDHFNLL